jgi:hypothetical protein
LFPRSEALPVKDPVGLARINLPANTFGAVVLDFSMETNIPERVLDAPLPKQNRTVGGWFNME